MLLIKSGLPVFQIILIDLSIVSDPNFKHQFLLNTRYNLGCIPFDVSICESSMCLDSDSVNNPDEEKPH